jgi:3'-phosphoadenosine 5'-phosphosulfate sulfotransferase (PAPS reductase)/FAD synthetase
LIAVWFSCGAASAAAAKLTLERFGGEHEVRVVNNPVAEEHSDNLRFLRDVEAWLGVPIETAVNSKYPEGRCADVWRDRRYMSGVDGAPCTVVLKKQARQEWETLHKPDWHVLGFTADEKKRHDRFVLTERDNVLPVLIDAGMTKQDCADMIHAAGLRLPEAYALGLPNANCLGCVKATSPTYWNLIRKVAPEAFEERARQSREIGARLVRVKGERIFLDELDPAACGAPLKTMQIECGIFCEEQDE